jgi:hypothetical protein
MKVRHGPQWYRAVHYEPGRTSAIDHPLTMRLDGFAQPAGVKVGKDEQIGTGIKVVQAKWVWGTGGRQRLRSAGSLEAVIAADGISEVGPLRSSGLADLCRALAK